MTVDSATLSSATGLVFDPTAIKGSTTVTNPFPILSTSTRSLEPTTTTSMKETPEAAVGASSKPIALSTVIGACVGAFIGAGAFILLALFFYRRYHQSLKRKANRRPHPRSIFDDGRNTRSELDRRRSKRESWNQLKDTEVEDKWEGMAGAPVSREVKEMDTLSPSVYRNAPTTTYPPTDDSPRTTAFKLHHPYGTAIAPKMPEPHDLLGREPQNVLGQIDSGPPMSWASDSKTSFLSATRLSGGAMSPTLTMAIPTPPAVKSQPHHWESAEVVNYSEPQTAEVVDYPTKSEGLQNPFFNASEYRRSVQRPPSSSHSRSSSNATIQQETAPVKEKERVVSIDPFRDPLPKPSFIHHIPSGSSSSSASNDRAIRQLVAAASLDDLGEDEVQRRLRVASMQPSLISNSCDSMYTDAEPDPADEAMMRSFPVPPSSSGHGSSHK